jgi:hypothetical protein
MARAKQTEFLVGKFICGWAEYKEGRRIPIIDSKGRLVTTEDKPPKIVTKMLIELEDGSCVPVNGEAFESLETHSIPISMKTIFPGKIKEMSKLPGEAYKKGDEVKLRKSTFANNGYTVYDEVE